MTVKSSQEIAGGFATVNGGGTLTAATDTPEGTLYVAGIANAATVTITGTNPYKWSVTLPTLIAGQLCQIYITATISGIAAGGYVWVDMADTSILSDVKTDTAAIKAKTDTIASGNITVISPVTADGDVEIDRGYDYYAADNRSLTWTDETPTTWPNLTDATATFIVGDYMSKECTITNPAGPATITLELSAAETELLPVGARPFRIECALSNTHIILQIRGVITVRD